AARDTGQRTGGEPARGAAPGGVTRGKRHRADARLRPGVRHAVRDPPRARDGVRRLPRARVLLAMTATAGVAGSEAGVRDAVHRLSQIRPGPHLVVTCYLKLEPRDRTRGKYLIKMKNRVRDALSALESQHPDHQQRETVRRDLERVQR